TTRSIEPAPNVGVPAVSDGRQEPPNGFVSVAPFEENKQRALKPVPSTPVDKLFVSGVGGQREGAGKEVSQLDATTPASGFDLNYEASNAPVLNVVLAPGSTEERRKLEDTVLAWNGSLGDNASNAESGSSTKEFTAPAAQAWGLVESLNELAGDASRVRIEV